MSEIDIYSPNKVQRLGLALVSTIGLTACVTNIEAREGMTPSQRYSFDYTSNSHSRVNDSDQGLEPCLEGTPYDYSKVVVVGESHDQVIVTPSSKNLEPLKFKGFTDLSSPLQPADTSTELVLESYDCKINPDGNYEVR